MLWCTPGCDDSAEKIFIMREPPAENRMKIPDPAGGSLIRAFYGSIVVGESCRMKFLFIIPMDSRSDKDKPYGKALYIAGANLFRRGSPDTDNAADPADPAFLPGL